MFFQTWYILHNSSFSSSKCPFSVVIVWTRVNKKLLNFLNRRGGKQRSFDVHVDGVRLCLWTAATNRPNVHPPEDTPHYPLSEIPKCSEIGKVFQAPRRNECNALRSFLDDAQAQVPLRSRRLHSRPYLPWFGAKHQFVSSSRERRRSCANHVSYAYFLRMFRPMYYKGVQYRYSKIQKPFGPKHFG
jgi:hypothetical protein